MNQFSVTFIDSGREPKCAPNPKYPNGMDVDAGDGGERTCSTDIPYPSPRCGLQLVTCLKCGYSIALTVAGRPDDPKRVTVPCRQLIGS